MPAKVKRWWAVGRYEGNKVHVITGWRTDKTQTIMAAKRAGLTARGYSYFFIDSATKPKNKTMP